MGAMSPLEELAYLKARNAYLEELVTAQKTPFRIVPVIKPFVHSLSCAM